MKSPSFILSLIGVACLMALGLTKSTDVSTPIVMLVTAYLGARAGQKASIIHSASKDVGCSTIEAIKEIEK